ncbi:hypothetical protein BCR33DRAFT_845021 [Rhizoclosmatium globosum]|uniref:Uncharacterized protein n=1 Tax=Rhizoclosmatium globosum TaxID=329046 RepID=A0A1Y2D3F0_9FUNG|nr:hypothetical protein BCR33DRAFT_845021 [Rhizoclosmatium globosum]|eukprot:ORY53780.1 hypothetical protein BCR33DRAFT_845021 [Rhizoclosmatium globosum]
MQALAPLVPSLVLGQLRRRLVATFPAESVPHALLAAALAGGVQSAVALALKVPSALEKAPEQAQLVSLATKDFWAALRITAMRNSAGFAVFFLVFEALKSKIKDAKLSAKAAQNLLAAALAATFYRITTWILDGKLPMLPNSATSFTDDDDELDEKTLGGKRGGNPYTLVLQQLKNSILKASIAMVGMDLLMGRPSW